MKHPALCLVELRPTLSSVLENYYFAVSETPAQLSQDTAWLTLGALSAILSSVISSRLAVKPARLGSESVSQRPCESRHGEPFRQSKSMFGLPETCSEDGIWSMMFPTILKPADTRKNENHRIMHVSLESGADHNCGCDNYDGRVRHSRSQQLEIRLPDSRLIGVVMFASEAAE